MSKSVKILGVVISALVLFLLVASVPAKAFVLNLDVKNNNVEKGQIVLFDVSIDMNSNENLPVSKLILQLSGKTNKTCEFSVDGIILSGCNGMTITPTINTTITTGAGYGYGYGYGSTISKLSYRIALDTKDYELGDYTTKLSAYSGTSVFTQTGRTVTIGSSSSGDYESDAISVTGKVCTNGAFTCSAWTDCIDGKQTRTCSVAPNCYFDQVPITDRICVEASPTGVLRLSSPYASIRVGDNVAGEEEKSLTPINQKTLITFLFVLIILIILLLILILVLVLVRRIGGKRKRVRTNRQMSKIMYKPVK